VKAHKVSEIADYADRFQLRDWERNAEKSARTARSLCDVITVSPITSSYGGYYYSPKQALLLDCLLQTLPLSRAKRTLCLASLIAAASACAAAPGHTAQPFKPSLSASRFLWEAWRRDVLEKTKAALESISYRTAMCEGRAFVRDAIVATDTLDKGDLVFIDPPYSEVQYSRFYHVLETLARGACDNVSGEGRYPPIDERPQSLFCLSTQSQTAITTLFSKLAERKVRAILTFPWAKASNGLSGEQIKKISEGFFVSKCKIIEGRFSTLGGNLVHRKARLPSSEMVLLLSPQ
jgi:adenine-specific DNA-methyltransferase